jgi:hypothetical protein
MLGACIALVVAWLSRAGFVRTSPTATNAATSEPAPYKTTHKFRTAPSVVQVDRLIQFTFSGDSTSPGSLVKMTMEMHNSEIEIAARLARDFKFSK